MCTGRPPASSTSSTASSTRASLIAGDIRISLAEVELLTIRIRLIVCSIDKAQEIGMDWWRHDPHFSASQPSGSAAENERAASARSAPWSGGSPALSGGGATPRRAPATTRSERAVQRRADRSLSDAR